MGTFLTRKNLARRTFIKGAGITLALPLLESMIPAATVFARTPAGQPPQRFFGMFYPHGMGPGWWEPKVEGPLPDKLPWILESLQNVKDQTVVLTGMWSKSAEPPPGTTGSDHFVAAAYLTGIKPKKTAGSDATVGSATIDQQIAKKIGQGTLLPSLQLACEDPNSSSSNCGEGYSCAYTNSISWVELPYATSGPDALAKGEMPPTSPLPMELNPQVVFERLFGSGGTPEERAKRMKESASILDAVVGELRGIKKNLPKADIRTLSEYTDDIREIERRLQLAAKHSTEAPDIDLPPGIPDQFDQHIKLQVDLAALALKSDITRVVTLLGARDLTSRVYPYPKGPLFPDGGTSPSFHGASHHQDDPIQIKKFADLNRYHVSTLAYVAEKLKSIPEGDGNLLDHSLVMYGTNMGNSNQHQHYDVPHILVGGANGHLKGGRHLHYPSKTVTTGNLLLSVLDMWDIEKPAQGDSDGRLQKL